VGDSIGIMLRLMEDSGQCISLRDTQGEWEVIPPITNAGLKQGIAIILHTSYQKPYPNESTLAVMPRKDNTERCGKVGGGQVDGGTLFLLER